ncbi:LacI family DNA-binding transcriptional regulator, partial [Vibrio campbellii]
MAVTFKEVAELAGVSTQTVSRVTNGAESVSATTRNKVLKAIDQLGYVPNKAAQALKANTKIIGVVSFSMAFHGAAMI